MKEAHPTAMCRRCGDPYYDHYIDPRDGSRRCDSCGLERVCRYLPPKEEV